MSLTSDQQKAKEEILVSIGLKQNHVLIGYAGTGKTYLTQDIAKVMHEGGHRCAFVAPTNKAVKVLQENIPFAECTTLHKLLCLKFEKGKLLQTDYPALEQYGVIFVDEASMVNAELFDLLLDNIPEFAKVSVVFIGDSAQLPPVGEKVSKAFNVEPVSKLSEIVRQAKESSIIPYSKQIREVGFNPKHIPIDRQYLLARPSAKKMAIAEKYLPTGTTIYCAWTNRAVNNMNYAIHDKIYGRDTPDFAIGEKIVMGQPWADPLTGEILANNGDEFEVKKIQKVKKGEYICWLIYVSQFGMEIYFPVVARESLALFEKHLNEYKGNKEWGPYFNLKERYADVRHTYAYTCHKLQGTTVKNIMIDVRDIMQNRKHDERNKLAYVAVTRASNKVLFLT